MSSRVSLSSHERQWFSYLLSVRFEETWWSYYTPRAQSWVETQPLHLRDMYWREATMAGIVYLGHLRLLVQLRLLMADVCTNHMGASRTFEI